MKKIVPTTIGLCFPLLLLTACDDKRVKASTVKKPAPAVKMAPAVKLTTDQANVLLIQMAPQMKADADMWLIENLRHAMKN